MNARMSLTGTKYLAMSLVCVGAPTRAPNCPTVIFRLMMPKRQMLRASRTPDPELPVVATSPITVSKRARRSCGTAEGRKHTRAGRPFGRDDDDAFASERRASAKRHTPHARTYGQRVRVDR